MHYIFLFKDNGPDKHVEHERHQGREFSWSLLEGQLQLSRNDGTRLQVRTPSPFNCTSKTKTKEAVIVEQTVNAISSGNTCIFKNHIVFIHDKITQVNTTNRQQFINLLKISFSSWNTLRFNEWHTSVSIKL